MHAEYIGTSPFDWVGDETSLPMGMAMYDLMGKIAEVPVWKLFGPMARRWVPVSAWFTATEPHRMAEAVAEYAAQGHTWMKYHVSPFHNVLEQTAAMQSAAPEGFQIHYDFTYVLTRHHLRKQSTDLVLLGLPRLSTGSEEVQDVADAQWLGACQDVW